MSLPISSLEHHIDARFIGGTGRCGTSIVLHILQHHPDLFCYSEPRLLCDRKGISDVLNRHYDVDVFRQHLKAAFCESLKRSLTIDEPDELYSLFDANRLTKLLDHCLEQPGTLPTKLSRFIQHTFSLPAEQYGRRFWVEKTPLTILVADCLFQLFPDMRYLHLIREPRDVCASMLQKDWGPNTVEEFIEHYCEVMEKSFQLQSAIPSSRYHVLSIETLVSEKSSAGFVLEKILGLTPDTHFENSANSLLSEQGANSGRWESELIHDEARRIFACCNPIYSRWKQREKLTLNQPLDPS